MEKLDFKGLQDVRESLLGEKKKQNYSAALLNELEEIEDRLYEDTERAKHIKLELEAVQKEFDLAGIRVGDLCFIARQVEGRRTLDKMLLLENGVKAAVIDKSMKKGEGYTERRFKNLKKKATGDGDDQ